MTKEEKWTAVLAYFDKEDQKVSLAEYKTKEHKQNKTMYASIWDKLDLNNDRYFDFDEFKSVDMKTVTPAFHKLLMSKEKHIRDKWENLLQFFDDKDQKISEEEFFGVYAAQNDADDPAMSRIRKKDFEREEGNFENCMTCDLFHLKGRVKQQIKNVEISTRGGHTRSQKPKVVFKMHFKLLFFAP